MNEVLPQVVWSMTGTFALGVAVFFLRFWHRAHDRLFLLFALGFAALAAHWSLLAVLDVQEESRHLVYLVRLAGFLLFLVAIIDKNRR